MTETPPYSTETSQTAVPDHGLGDTLRSLRRSSNNRMVAGVLGGIGRQFGIDPVVLRVIAAVLAIFGGVGVLFYALAWLLIPADDEAGSIADQALGRVEPRGNHAGPLAIGLTIAVLVSGSVVISGSLLTVLLLALTVAGAYLLLRGRADDDTDDADGPRFHGHAYRSSSPSSDVPEPDYPRSWPPSDMDPATESSGPATEPVSEAPTEPVAAGAWHDTESDRYAQPASSGNGPGWPEGPDWGPYQPPWTPDPATEAAPAKTKKRSSLAPITLCVALVVLGTMAVNDVTWATFPPALYIAVALAIIGGGLVIGSWFGRSRGLIALGMLLTLALVPATWADQWEGSTGTITHRITSMEQLPAEPVEHGAGQVVYNLAQLDVPEGEEADVTIELGFGDLTVFVPREVDLTVHLSMGFGSATIRNEQTGGMGTEITRRYPGDDPDAGTIVLDLDMGAGDIKVVNR